MLRSSKQCIHQMTFLLLRHDQTVLSPLLMEWRPTYRSTAKCFGEGAVAPELLLPGSPGFLSSVKQLRFSLLFVVLTVVISNFPIALVAASNSASTISTALQMYSNSSNRLAHERLFQTSNRKG
jgi:sensor histidine kinase YesM